MCIIDPLFWTEALGKQQEQAQSIALTGIDTNPTGAAFKGSKNKFGKSKGGGGGRGGSFGQN